MYTSQVWFQLSQAVWWGLAGFCGSRLGSVFAYESCLGVWPTGHACCSTWGLPPAPAVTAVHAASVPAVLLVREKHLAMLSKGCLCSIVTVGHVCCDTMPLAQCICLLNLSARQGLGGTHGTSCATAKGLPVLAGFLVKG
jgi:hypothetical protein